MPTLSGCAADRGINRTTQVLTNWLLISNGTRSRDSQIKVTDDKRTNARQEKHMVHTHGEVQVMEHRWKQLGTMKTSTREEKKNTRGGSEANPGTQEAGKYQIKPGQNAMRDIQCWLIDRNNFIVCIYRCLSDFFVHMQSLCKDLLSVSLFLMDHCLVFQKKKPEWQFVKRVTLYHLCVNNALMAGSGFIVC